MRRIAYGFAFLICGSFLTALAQSAIAPGLPFVVSMILDFLGFMAIVGIGILGIRFLDDKWPLAMTA